MISVTGTGRSMALAGTVTSAGGFEGGAGAATEARVSGVAGHRARRGAAGPDKGAAGPAAEVAAAGQARQAGGTLASVLAAGAATTHRDAGRERASDRLPVLISNRLSARG